MRRTNINKLRGRLAAKIWIAALGVVLMSLAAPVVLGDQTAWAADSCTAPATTYGTDTMHTPSSEAAGSYTIYTHMKIPSSSANGILLNVVGTCYNVGGSTSIPANTWEWIDYYDGNSGNVVKQTMGQGSQTVVLTGTSSGVLVDEIEFVPSASSCVPTGDGSNCKTAVTTTGGGSTGGGGGGTTGGGGATGGSGGGSGPVNVVHGGTFTPTTTSTPTQVTAPVTLQPGVSDPSDGNVLEVQYYLNNKLLATVTTAPFTYKLDTTKILNGTYTLTTKTTYDSGKVVSTSQKIIVKNPFSLMQLMLAAEHYIILEIVLLIILIVGFRVLRKRMQARQAIVSSVMPVMTTSGDVYSPLSYTAPSPYSAETPTSVPPLPGQTVGGTPPTGVESSNPLPYSNTPSFPATGAQPQVPPDTYPPTGNNNRPQ